MAQDYTLQGKLAGKTLGEVFNNMSKTNANAIKVATLGVIKKITREFDGYGTATVAPFPLGDDESEYTIVAYFFSDSFEEGDVVLIIFTDYDFRTNVTTSNYSQKKQNNKNKHSNAFGVICRL